MSDTLYLECLSGISGDMTVAALLDLGADGNVLRKALKSLDIDGYSINISKVVKSGITACDFDVVLDKEHENHDHDMEYLHGKDGGHDHSHIHSHEHRTLSDILEIINNSDITVNAKNIAEKIFNILGDAESKVHGVSKENVAFHEVGAVDSIVDIVAAAVCVDNLGIKNVIVPNLCEGTGFVRCRHGILPVPVPAVANIVSDNHLNMRITDAEGEFVTPTGAAIAAALITSDKLPDSFTVEKIGIGAGKREYEKPSLLRAYLINCKSDDSEVCKLETNIDDCTGEAMGYVMEKLFSAGAKDVNFMPVFMKKCRPAYQLNVICEKSDAEKLEGIIFDNTTTIGIRRFDVSRTVLHRENVSINTCYGSVRVKKCRLPSGDYRYYPEYEDISAVCEKHGLSYQEVYNRIISFCADKGADNEWI